MGYYREAINVLKEEIGVAETNGDFEYADVLKSVLNRAPTVWKDIKKNYGARAGEVFYDYIVDAIEFGRSYARGITRKQLFHYVPPEVILRDVYAFSKKRGFRYGKRIEYIVKDLGVAPSVVRNHVGLLKDRGLVFIKVWRGNEYVFPTKAGRKFVETKLR